MTDVKPKMIVSHPAKGLVGKTKENFFGPGVVIEYIDDQGRGRETVDLNGWEPARIAGPDEVVVKVDDLDLSYWAERDENASGTLDAGKIAIRAGKAWSDLEGFRSQAPSLPVLNQQPSRVQTLLGEKWTRRNDGRYYCLTRCGLASLQELEAEYGTLTFLDDAPTDESPTTVEVSLPCPKKCGQPVMRKAELYETSDGGYDLRFLSMKDRPEGLRHHLCSTIVPDEPTEAGVKVSLGDQRFVSTDYSMNGRVRLYINLANGMSSSWSALITRSKRSNTPLIIDAK